MQERKLTTVLSMGSEQDMSRWERLDDVIMGGQSSSSLKGFEGGAALFSGELILEGGGFCGARTRVGTPACSYRCSCSQGPSTGLLCHRARTAGAHTGFTCQ